MDEITQIENWMMTALIHGDFIAYAQYRARRDDLRAAAHARDFYCLDCQQDLSSLLAEHGTGEAAWEAHCAADH